MSFPLRLTADLTLAWASRAVGGANAASLIEQVCCDKLFGLNSAAAPATGNDKYRAPILWMSGSDALDYPQAALFANSHAAGGRHVFLETSGFSLKPRLHEFQPSANFCFVIRHDGSSAAPARKETDREGQRIGLEALRMARLAGFYTCARIVLDTNFPNTQVEALYRQLSGLDIDGVLITPADSNAILAKQAAALRRRWLNWPCTILSSLLDSTLPSPVLQPSSDRGHSPMPKSRNESRSEEVEA